MPIINGDTQLIYKRLPHLERDGASYFITLRLRGSLPLSVRAANVLRETRSLDELDEFLKSFEIGPNWLANPECAQVVADVFHELESAHASVECFTVMPNHVHVILTPYEGVPLSAVMKQFKQKTAFRCIRLCAAESPLWESEHYDHILRKGEYAHLVPYIVGNPVKASLCHHWKDWPFTYLRKNFRAYHRNRCSGVTFRSCGATVVSKYRRT